MLRYTLENVEVLIDEDNMEKMNKLDRLLIGITNVWESQEGNRDEVPNILNYYDKSDNLIYHNEANFKLSNGIRFPEISTDVRRPTDLEILENAKRINLLIRDSNSLKVDFSQFEKGVPSWEQLLEVLSQKNKGDQYLKLYGELKSRLV